MNSKNPETIPQPKSIRLTLEQIHEEAKTDLYINPDNLILESIKAPILFSKYSKMYSIEETILENLELSLSSKIKKAVEYYTGKADPEVYKEKPLGKKILNSNLDIYVDSDEEVQETKKRIIAQKAKVKALDRILKHINDRQWSIRNSIESKKFDAGL
jgi:hypothetical protein